MNFIFGWILLIIVFAVGTPIGVFISEVRTGSPAEIANLKIGDELIDYDSSNEFINFIKSEAGNEIVLRVRREGNTLNLNITPRLNPREDEGALGVILQEGGGKLPLLDSIWEAFKLTGYLIYLVVVGLFSLIVGLFTNTAQLEGVYGPIGIANFAVKELEYGVIFFVRLVALISINLGALNSIPFPALDGGRFLFIILEKIKGAPLKASFEKVVNSIGFAILLLLMILITARDVVKLF